MSAWYLSLSGILPPFSKAHTEGKTLKMTPKRYTKTVYLRMSDRNGEGANYAENEQEAPVGVVFLLK